MDNGVVFIGFEGPLTVRCTMHVLCMVLVPLQQHKVHSISTPFTVTFRRPFKKAEICVLWRQAVGLPYLCEISGECTIRGPGDLSTNESRKRRSSPRYALLQWCYRQPEEVVTYLFSNL